MINLNNSNVASRFHPVSIQSYLKAYGCCKYQLRYNEVQDKLTNENIIAAVGIFIVQRVRDLQIYDYPK